MRTILCLAALLLLSGCAGYGGQGLKVGTADLQDIRRVMGVPAQEWEEPGGVRRLAYPRGPMGTHTYMAEVDAGGKLTRFENVLTVRHFADVRKGMNREAVARLLGPVDPASGITYYAARDELVWEWLYCDDWSQLARFYVLFDGSKHYVRSTMSLPDYWCAGGDQGTCWCSH